MARATVFEDRTIVVELQLKGLIMRRLICVVALFAAGCAYHNPNEPSSLAMPKPGVPALLELATHSGFGAAGGTATIDATVRDAYSANLGGVTVAFSTASGTISAEAVTNDKGVATALLTAAPGGVLVTATVGTLSYQTLVAVQPLR